MTGKQVVNIEDVLFDAEDAFWAKVVEHFPLTESGDMFPDESHVLTESLKRAITAWHYINAKDFYDLKRR